MTNYLLLHCYNWLIMNIWWKGAVVMIVYFVVYHICRSMSRMQAWIKNALLSIIKKNYYHKKSGVRLSLDEKHEWDRVVKPIEQAIGKVLLTHPYQPPVVAVDGSKAMLLALKNGSAPPKDIGKHASS